MHIIGFSQDLTEMFKSDVSLHIHLNYKRLSSLPDCLLTPAFINLQLVGQRNQSFICKQF